MGFDNECIINIQSLAGEYFCPVCRLLVYPNEALQTQCTHLYCKPCLTYVVSTTRACPYDGYLVTEADSKPLLESNKAMADTIGKISVHCLYHRSGCTWQGPLSECMSHCSGCAFGNSPVVCNSCGVQIVHRQVQEHAQSCPGVQPQSQQPDGVTQAAATGTAATSDQGQSVAAAGVSGSQAQTSQVSAAPPAGQNPSQQANSVTQAQASLAATPTPEQWYQQQQKYQQYYQQYPGYDPYQQQYQQFYPYQQQAVQQFQQQPIHAYPSQVPGQLQPQAYVQPQPQPQFQSQQQVHAQAQPQNQQQPHALAPAQSQSLPQAQASLQQQVHPAAQPQPQFQAQGQAPSHSLLQSQPYPLAQPYSQPQPVQPVAPQPMQMPQYPQTQTQLQHPHAQMQPQPYPQPQAQRYPHPQSQPQVQVQPSPHSQPSHPPTQPSQPINPGAQLQGHPSVHVVTGFQSYPQPPTQQQMPVGASHPMHMSGPYQQPQQPGQIQGHFPQQPAQMHLPQSHAMITNQQPPALLPSQVQPQSGPVGQQPPVHPHAQQTGYQVQRPVMQPQQAASQQYVQQQAFSMQGPYAQQPPPMQAQLRAQGLPQAHQPSQQNFALPHAAQLSVPQNYVARPAISHSTGPPSAPAAGLANAGHARPTQLSAAQPSVNQNYPLQASNQLTSTEQLPIQVQQTIKSGAVEKPGDQIVEHRIQGQDNIKEDPRDTTSGMGTQSSGMRNVKSENGVNYVDDQKSLDGHENETSFADSSAKELPDVKQMLGTETELNASKNGLAVQDAKLKVKEDATENISEASGGGKTSGQERADVNKRAEGSLLENEVRDAQRGAHGAPLGSVSTLHQPHFVSHVSGSHSAPTTDQGRNQLPLMHYGPPHQPRPAVPSVVQSIPHSGSSQHTALLGHPPSQLRPQGPGQIPPTGQPFTTPDSDQPPTLKQPHSVVHPENPSGGILGPGSAASFPRGPGNMGPPQGHYNQGNVPPYVAGQPRIPLGEPFGAPPFVAQPPGSTRGGAMGRAPAHVSEGSLSQQRPPNPTDVEMFPAQRPGFFDGRQLDLHSHGAMERGPYFPPSAMKLASGPRPDLSSAFGVRDERFKVLPEENLKHFPAETMQHPAGHRDFENRKFTGPSYLDGGPSANFGSQFPLSRGLDHQAPPVFGGDGMPRPFEKAQHGFDQDSAAPSRFLPPFHHGGSLHRNDEGDRSRPLGFHDDNLGRADLNRSHLDFPEPVPEFGRRHVNSLTPRSPGRDYAGLPSRGFGNFTGGEIEGNESRSFGGGSKPFDLSSDPLGKAMHENRFPAPPGHLQGSELDRPGNLPMGNHPGVGPPVNHSRAGDVIFHDVLPGHLRRGEHFGPRNTDLGEGTGFGSFVSHGRIGDRPMAGNFPSHLPVGESFRGDRVGHPRLGEPGFRSSYTLPRYAHDSGFLPVEKETFDYSGKRKPVMCRICRVDCETVEGLDLHSQTREHQKKAMDMVLRIKQQNSKKQKTSNDRSSLEDGNKPRNASFEGHGNKQGVECSSVDFHVHDSCRSLRNMLYKISSFAHSLIAVLYSRNSPAITRNLKILECSSVDFQALGTRKEHRPLAPCEFWDSYAESELKIYGLTEGKSRISRANAASDSVLGST
ncbi:hypothetical protein Nepgr_013021 [Nepenthes gracilis]|uniref:RING-type domain-containing protein n=1 Tax=Nepenthes gracilis TaxID=150966 RepID=A0AAD3SGR9_NEPGR|nr:hypothetical protein Nepgr_013021 [Nepenthes gracilis]